MSTLHPVGITVNGAPPHARCTRHSPAPASLFTLTLGLISHEGMRFQEQCPNGCCVVYQCRDCGMRWTVEQP